MTKRDYPHYLAILEELSSANKKGGRLNLELTFDGMYNTGIISKEEYEIVKKAVVQEKLDGGIKKGERHFGDFSEIEILSLAKRCLEIKFSNIPLQ